MQRGFDLNRAMRFCRRGKEAGKRVTMANEESKVLEESREETTESMRRRGKLHKALPRKRPSKTATPTPEPVPTQVTQKPGEPAAQLNHGKIVESAVTVTSHSMDRTEQQSFQ